MDDERKLTKKEMKALRRLEREQKEMASSSSSNSKKWFILGFAALLFVGFFGYMIYLSKQQKAENAQKALQVVSQNGTVRGDKNAAITLVEYGDLQCPSCKAAQPVVRQVLKDMKNVKLVFKHFPLSSLHANAMDGAKAVEAAGRQNKFFEMMDLLYEKQEEWTPEANPEVKFEEYAKTLGLDIAKFKQDIKDSAIEEKIKKERDEGISVGVSGTPTFFVNGQQIQNPGSAQEFESVIKKIAAQK